MGSISVSRVTALSSVWVGSKPELLKSTAAEISKTLEGAKIERVHRVGKHIVFDLKSKDDMKSKDDLGSKDAPQWIVHPGYDGKDAGGYGGSRVAEAHSSDSQDGFLGESCALLIRGAFGRLEVRQSGFSGPGAEPLQISVEEFSRLFHGSKAPIKGALSIRSCYTAWGISMLMKL